MTALHRWLIVFYSVLLIAVCIGLALLAWNQQKQLDIDLSGFRLVSSIASGTSEKWAFSFLLLVVALFGAVTFAYAIVPPGRPKRGVFHLRQPDGTVVEVSAEALETMLKDELELLPDVRIAWPAIHMVAGQIQPDVTLLLEPQAQVQHVSAAVAHLTVETLKERVGLTAVLKPGIGIAYDELTMAATPAPGSTRSGPSAAGAVSPAAVSRPTPPPRAPEPSYSVESRPPPPPPPPPPPRAVPPTPSLWEDE